MRRISLLLVLLLAAALPAAAENPAADRLDVEVTPQVGEDSATVDIRTRAGTVGTENSVTVGPDRLRLTNPPMAGAVELSPDGPVIEDEETFGPPVAAASLGTGGLTTATDEAGRLTNLSWPSPGHWDHVNFLNVTQGWPNKGAPDNAGSFGGLGTSWMTPAEGWRTVEQSYTSDRGQTFVTVLAHDALDLRVRITEVVHPTEDLLARNFRVLGKADAPFGYYANLNPTTGRVPRVPSVPDAFLDNGADFGMVYAEEHGALVGFRPYTVDPASASRLATSQPGPEQATAAVEGSFGPGVYVAVAGQGHPETFQAGVDSLGLVREEAEGSPLLDPYLDLSDGELSGSIAAFGKTAGGLAGLPADPDGSYTVWLSAAEDPQTALATVERAREQGFHRVRAASEADWASWIDRARLPATDDARTVAVARRALMLIRTAQDRETGAIVANATTQTPYREDWVRDGAFFNYALLLAGYPEMVAHHNDFYRRIYRPGGTWDSFYYADGAEAGAVYPYEIDSQAFALWALWLPHELGMGTEVELAASWPAIRDTADALLLCRDPRSGLNCPAQEDDSHQLTQGAQGAASVYLALRSAVAAAEALGTSPNPEWAARAEELREAARRELCDPGCPGGRGGIYLVWPSRLLDWDDPKAQGLLDRFADRMDARAAFAEPEVGGFFQYPMEAVLGLAPAWQADDREERLDAWMTWLAHDVAHPGTMHYGERIFRSGDREYRHSVGFPHIWSGAETYIGAAFTYGVRGCPAGARGIGEAACEGDG